MKKMQAILGFLMVVVLVTGAFVSAAIADESEKLTIAYQYGLAYAPLVLAQSEKFIENSYAEATGKSLEIEWVQMSSGADINTGIISGSVDVGFMGLGPAITGISKGVGYKIFTNLSGQEHGLMTREEKIQTLDNMVNSDYQIALVNIGSIQHIILAKALFDTGLNAHALDANIVAMKHPDGMSALLTGSVAAHLTTSPYIFTERTDEALHEIEAVKAAWPKENSFIVGVAAISLYEKNPELYKALCDGVAAAIDYVNDHTEETAAVTCQYDGNSVENEADYLRQGSYTIVTGGVEEIARFMYENDFLETDPGSYRDLVFDNVQGN